MASSGPKDNRNEFSFWSKIFNIKFRKLTKMSDEELYWLTKDTKDDFAKNSERYRSLLNENLKDEFSMAGAQCKENSIFLEIKKMMTMPEDLLYTKVRDAKRKYEEQPIKLDDLPQLATLLLSAFPRTQENVDRLMVANSSVAGGKSMANSKCCCCKRTVPKKLNSTRYLPAPPRYLRPAVKPVGSSHTVKKNSTSDRCSRTVDRKKSWQN